MNPSEWVILIVEDEFDSLQTISAILEHHGIQVRAAHNGIECLQVLTEVAPTAVLMDLAMPEMDGWQTLTQIRANPATARLPVVAVTAFYSTDVGEDVLKAGFNGYFTKPVRPASFIKQLAQVIDACPAAPA